MERYGSLSARRRWFDNQYSLQSLNEMSNARSHIGRLRDETCPVVTPSEDGGSSSRDKLGALVVRRRPNQDTDTDGQHELLGEFDSRLPLFSLTGRHRISSTVKCLLRRYNSGKNYR
jgi:hypothetical protein